MAGVVGGYQVKFGLGTESTPGTGVAATMQFEIAGAVTNMNEDLLDPGGLRGTRSHQSERVRQNTRAPAFSVTIHPNSVELDYLLPLILGGAESADSFPLADALSSTTGWFEVTNKRYRYLGSMVSRARFYSSQGAPLAVDLDFESMDMDEVATAFASLTLSTVAPYIHSDLAATISATAYKFRDVEITIDNGLKVDRFFNSQTRISLIPTDRTVTWSLNGPYGDNQATYALATGGVAAVCTYTNGGYVLTFTSSKLQVPRQPPQLAGRDEVMLPLVGVGRRATTTDELQVTNDSVP